MSNTIDDRQQRLARNADLSKTSLHINDLKLRSMYDERLDNIFLKPDQRFLILTTFGPTAEYDVQCPKTGFRFWGACVSEEQAVKRVEMLHKDNPFAALMTLHIVQVGSFIELPPPTDIQNLHTFHANQREILQNHLDHVYTQGRQAVQAAEYTQYKNLSTKKHVDAFNCDLQAFNDKRIYSLIDDFAYRFDDYIPATNTDIVRPGEKPLWDDLASVRRIPVNSVDNFIKIFKSSQNICPTSTRSRIVKKQLNANSYALINIVETKLPSNDGI